MLTFKQFLTEAVVDNTTDITPAGKDKARLALAKAAGITSAMSSMQAFFKKATDANMQDHYNKFVEAFPKEANAINNLKPDGVGPGELVLYFLFDNVGIGGKNAPIDIYLNGKEFAEAKKGDRSGASTIVNFKVTKDGDKAVSQLMKELEDFNHKYHDITGEDLPGWRDAGSVRVNSVKEWREIDLKELAGKSTDGPKKPIDLVLKKDGDLIRKGESDPIVNVKTAKSIKPIKSLIDGSAGVAVDDKVSTLDKIIARWVDQAFEDYIGGKKFALFDDKLKMRHFGTLTKDMVGLYCTNRNQPWAEVYLAPKSKPEKTEGKAK